MERRGARPTFDVNGLWGGYAGPGPKTVLPCKAGAKFSFRLVPDQDPAEVGRQVRRHIEEHCPPGVTWELEEMHGAPAVVVEVKGSPGVEAATRAIEAGFGRPPVFIREGGSIPVVGLLKTHLGVDTLLLGWGQNDDNLHGPNEKFSLADFHRGIKASAHLLGELALIGGGNPRMATVEALPLAGPPPDPQDACGSRVARRPARHLVGDVRGDDPGPGGSLPPATVLQPGNAGDHESSTHTTRAARRDCSARFVEDVLVGLRIAVRAGRANTTFKNEEAKKTLEPDDVLPMSPPRLSRSSGGRAANRPGDPPPDLAIEVEVGHPATDRSRIYASLGIREVWKYDGDRLRIEELGRDGTFSEAPPTAGSCRSGRTRSAPGSERARAYDRLPDLARRAARLDSGTSCRLPIAGGLGA